MPAVRHHFHCEACEGTWVAEAEVEIAVTADCPFCEARDVFAYRSEGKGARHEDPAKIAKRLAAKLRRAAGKAAPATAEPARIRRAG